MERSFATMSRRVSDPEMGGRLPSDPNMSGPWAKPPKEARGKARGFGATITRHASEVVPSWPLEHPVRERQPTAAHVKLVSGRAWKQRARPSSAPAAAAAAAPAAVADPRSHDEALAYDRALDAGLSHFAASRHSDAIVCFRRCAHLWPQHHTPPYNLACCYAAVGRLDDAARYLWAAVERGVDIAELAEDPDLATLIAAPDFPARCAEWRKRLEAGAQPAKRERERPWRTRPSSASSTKQPRSRPSSAASAGRARSKRPQSAPPQSASWGTQPRPQSAPAPAPAAAGVAPVATVRRSRPPRHGAQRRSRRRRTSAASNTMGSRASSGKVFRHSTLRPSSAARPPADPSSAPDYLSKGYGTAGFGGPERVVLEVGNTWAKVPHFHARLACQCGAAGAALFPTTVAECEERLDNFVGESLPALSTQSVHLLSLWP